MATVRTFLSVTLMLSALAGCAAGQTIVLLPGERGHPVGGVRVLAKDGSAQVVLNQAGQGLSGNSTTPRQILLKPQYTELEAGLPLPAKSFTLTFAPGAELLPEQTEANRRTIDYIRDEMALRPGAEVQVTGHTDALGGPNFDSDALSLKRAENFRAYLIANGFPADEVSAVGRGKREPVDPNNDAANRRIEVIVR